MSRGCMAQASSAPSVGLSQASVSLLLVCGTRAGWLGHHLDYSLVESGLCMSIFISLWNESCVVGASSAPLVC